jgi:signal transduction histidine kinase
MEEMGQSLHRIALELRPTSIDDLGLHAALANYLAEWSGRYSIEADFQCGFERLDALQQDVRTTTYRVIQEAMNNVAKHAIDARSVSVIIECLSFVLHVTVEDDGQGFNVTEMGAGNSSQRRRGLGLMGMRERVSLIGGNFEIESSIGVGTTVFVRIPLDQTGAPS